MVLRAAIMSCLSALVFLKGVVGHFLGLRHSGLLRIQIYAPSMPD